MSDVLEATLDQARERLLDQVFAANTLAQVADARAALRQWMRAHPDEQGMRDGFEALSHRQDYLEAHEAHPADEPSLTRRMQGLSREERQRVMAGAAEVLAGHYQSDPEMRDWQALDGEPFHE